VGVVGPKLLYPNSNLIQHCGTVFNEDGVGEHLYRFLPSSYVPANKVRNFKSLTGACLLIRKKDFQEVGGFDTVFRMGGEDTDLCFKMLARQKFALYCPTSVVFHHEGHTRGRRDQADADDTFNRETIKKRWKDNLHEDISDYCLLGEIESHEKRTWRWLQDVPQDIIARYDSKMARQVGRYPFKCELGCGMSPQDGYIHIDVIAEAPSIEIVHDISRPLPFLDNTVGEILANHVLEHLSWRILPAVVKDMHRVLVTDGLVYIRTPNLRFVMERYHSGKLTDEHPDDESKIRELYEDISAGMWANLKLFSGQDYPSNFHYVCMDPDDLRQVFLRAGFHSVKLAQFGREFSPGEIQLVAAK
jgi:predicted SAM-dependent methyltransferase